MTKLAAPARRPVMLGLVVLGLSTLGGAGPANAVFGEDHYVRSKDTAESPKGRTR